MKIAIAGGTGFVGNTLVNELVKNNHEVVILTRKLLDTNRNGKIRYVQWLSHNSETLQDLQDTEIFINLAGESINSGPWTEKRKSLILTSRIEAVKEMLNIPPIGFQYQNLPFNYSLVK